MQRLQDLDLRLGGSSFLPKEDIIMSRNCWRESHNVITIDDDDDGDVEGDGDQDDEVIVYSPRAVRLFPISGSWVPVVTEEDLELRLGTGVHSTAGMRNHDRRGESLQTQKCVKTKYGSTSSSRNHTVEVEGVKLTCTICMDMMKEETSTMCGHVFCKSCITDAILIQKRCPTCRKELSITNIHRIYLPGATS